MLVILFVIVGVVLVLYGIKRKDTTYLAIGLAMFTVGIILEVSAPAEKVMVEQNQLLGTIVAPEHYILYSQHKNTVLFRYMDNNSTYGWIEERLAENYKVITEEPCNNPRREVYKNKVIGVIKVSPATDVEEIRLYVPANRICIL